LASGKINARSCWHGAETCSAHVVHQLFFLHHIFAAIRHHRVEPGNFAGRQTFTWPAILLEEAIMKKTLIALAAAATLGLAAITTSSPAEARWGGWGGWGGGAVLGGFAAGAIVGSAFARPYYGPGYGYYGGPGYGYYGGAYPAYYGGYGAYGPGCFWQRQRVFAPGWGWTVRRVRVCY
jgi:hypothetical protein